MEKDDESIYFVCPERCSLELVKKILQYGYPFFSEPSLQSNDKIQSFTEEDVNNVGIDKLCRQVMNGSYNTCVVLRIPKAYFGQPNKDNIDMSPIFCQEHEPETAYMPMHGLIYGVYSEKTNGFIESPNYSPASCTFGILSDDQRAFAERIAQDPKDPERARIYREMLEHDTMVRDKYRSTYEVENDEKLRAELESYYLDNPNLRVAQNIWGRDPNLHNITDQEFAAAIERNKNQNMVGGM